MITIYIVTWLPEIWSQDENDTIYTSFAVGYLDRAFPSSVFTCYKIPEESNKEPYILFRMRDRVTINEITLVLYLGKLFKSSLNKKKYCSTVCTGQHIERQFVSVNI